jgi:hypothetical protein
MSPKIVYSPLSFYRSSPLVKSPNRQPGALIMALMRDHRLSSDAMGLK